MNEYCCIFNINENEYKKYKDFELMKDYGEIASPNECKRKLFKCKKCGKLFLYQFLEWNIGFDDLYYEDYIQVKNQEEADSLNSELKYNNFSLPTKPMIKIGADNIVHYRLPKTKVNMEDSKMKEKVIRLIIYYVISVYNEDKRTKESCLELAELLLYMIQKEETKADELLKPFPSKHPVSLLYMEIKDIETEELKEILEKAKISIREYSFDKNDLNKLEDDKEVEELSKKISGLQA